MKTCCTCKASKDDNEYSAKSARCKACVRANNQERYADSAEWRKSYRAREDVLAKRAEHHRNWKANNPEKVRAMKKAWKLANPEKVAEKHRARTVNNPGVVRAQKAKRRAAKFNATPAWADHEAIYKIYKQAAAMRKAGHDVHVDHAVPLMHPLVCGLHVEHNLQILPARENLSKRNLFIV